MSEDTYTDTRPLLERVRAQLQRQEQVSKPSVKRTARRAVLVLDDGERYGLPGRTVQVSLYPDPRQLERKPAPRKTASELLDDDRSKFKPWRIDRGETIPLRGAELPRRFSLERVDEVTVTEQATTQEALFAILLATGWDRAELVRNARDWEQGRTSMRHLAGIVAPWAGAFAGSQ